MEQLKNYTKKNLFEWSIINPSSENDTIALTSDIENNTNKEVRDSNSPKEGDTKCILELEQKIKILETMSYNVNSIFSKVENMIHVLDTLDIKVNNIEDKLTNIYSNPVDGIKSTNINEIKDISKKRVNINDSSDNSNKNSDSDISDVDGMNTHGEIEPYMTVSDNSINDTLSRYKSYYYDVDNMSKCIDMDIDEDIEPTTNKEVCIHKSASFPTFNTYINDSSHPDTSILTFNTGYSHEFYNFGNKHTNISECPKHMI